MEGPKSDISVEDANSNAHKDEIFDQQTFESIENTKQIKKSYLDEPCSEPEGKSFQHEDKEVY